MQISSYWESRNKRTFELYKQKWLFFNKMLWNRTIPPCEKVVVEGTNPVLVFQLGAPAYFVLPFQVVAKIQFENSSSNSSSAHVIIMNSIGTLKACFRCLQCMNIDMDVDINTLPKVIYSFFSVYSYCD